MCNPADSKSPIQSTYPPRLLLVPLSTRTQPGPKLTGEGSNSDVYSFLQGVGEVISQSQRTSEHDTMNGLTDLISRQKCFARKIVCGDYFKPCTSCEEMRKRCITAFSRPHKLTPFTWLFRMAESIRNGLPKESIDHATDNKGSIFNNLILNLEDIGWLGDNSTVSLELVS